MTQLTEGEIKAAFSAIETARCHKNMQLQTATLAARTQIRSEAEKLLVPYLKKTGLDITPFQAAKERAQTEIRRLAQEQKEQAVARSASVAARLRSADKSRLKTKKWNAKFVPVLGIYTASMIVPSSNLEMDGSNMESLNNWAKVRGQWSSNDNENLRFIFMWSNPNDTEAVINVASYLSLNGSCQVIANGGAGGIFPGGNTSLNLTAVLNVWELWHQPPISLSSQTQQDFSLAAHGGGWFESVGAIVPGSIDQAFGDLEIDQLLLPPNAAVAFETTFQVGVQIDEGSGIGVDPGTAQIDFSSGGFEVRCPLVEVAILT